MVYDRPCRRPRRRGARFRRLVPPLRPAGGGTCLATGGRHASPRGARHAAPGVAAHNDRSRCWMRVPNSAHTSRPWRIRELTRDFRLEDVWALPGGGGPDDFPRLVQMIASRDPSQSASRAVRALFAIRWKIGELLGWDGPDAGVGSRVPTLRDRLPADLRDAPSGPDFDALPFTPLYLLDDEWAAEI